MSIFSRKCVHPFNRLHVQKEQTIEVIDADFEHITYHLVCGKCNEVVTLKHAKLIHGAKAFLASA